jgi:hypothetical protein
VREALLLLLLLLVALDSTALVDSTAATNLGIVWIAHARTHARTHTLFGVSCVSSPKVTWRLNVRTKVYTPRYIRFRYVSFC